MADGYLLENGTDKYLLEDGSGVLLIDAPPVLESISADASGYSGSAHLFWAVNSARWWMLFVDPTTPTVLRSAYSTDLLTWTAGATKTMLHSAKGGSSSEYGGSIGVAYKNISSTDVVHITAGWQTTGVDTGIDHVRATISGTTISFGTMAAIATGGVLSNQMARGPALSIDSNNRPQLTFPINGNVTDYRATNTDSGSAWTAGWDASVDVFGTPSQSNNGFMFSLGGGVSLGLSDNGESGAHSAKNIIWEKSSATGVWTINSGAVSLAAPTTAAFNASDWGAVARTTTDVHLVVKNPDVSNAFIHRRFNGTSWSAGQSITTQAMKAGTGVFLCSDGTDVWMFVIDSDAANTVRYIKWSSGSSTWGSWTAFETSTKVRTNVSGYRDVVAGVFGICWTETDAPFVIVTKPFALPVAYSELARTVTIAITVSRTDVMSRPISELTDDFPGASLDGAKWTTSSTPATVSAGKGHLNPNAANDYVSILSVNKFNTFGGSYHAEFVALPANSPGASNQSGISLRLDANNTIEFGLWGVNLGYILTGTVAADNGSGFIAYNATTHKWLRIRADATTLYFDTSPDGVTWTNRFTNAMVSYGVGALQAGAFAGWYGVGDSDTGEATIDKVNLPGGTVYDETNRTVSIAVTVSRTDVQHYSDLARLVTAAVTVGGAAMLSPKKLFYDFTSGIGNWHCGGPNQTATHDTTTAWAINSMKLRKTDFTGGVESIRADDGVQPTLDWRPFGRAIQFWGWAGVKVRMRIEIYNGTVDVVGPWTELQDATWTPIQSSFNDSDLATAQHFSLVAENISGIGGDLSFWVDTIEQGTILSPERVRLTEARTATIAATVTAPTQTQHHQELGRTVSIATTVTVPTQVQAHKELNRLVSIAVPVTETDVYTPAGPVSYQELNRTVTIAVTVSRTDTQVHKELDRAVTIANTVSAPTQALKLGELNRTVTTAVTVSVSTQVQAHKELNRTVTTAVTVTATDTLSGIANETNRLVSIPVTVSRTDIQAMQELARTVNVATTVSRTDIQAHKELDRAVTATATVSATTVQHTSELVRLVALAVTVTRTDIQAHKELARLSSTVVTVTATDTQFNQAQEFRTVTLAVTVTAVDVVRRIDTDKLVSITTTVSATGVQHNADLARLVLAAVTVSASAIQHMAEARALTILVSVLATDFYRPLESLAPWHQPAGTITSATGGAVASDNSPRGAITNGNPQGIINKLAGDSTITDVIPDTTITDRRG